MVEATAARAGAKEAAPVEAKEDAVHKEENFDGTKLNDNDLAEFIKLQTTRADSPKSWSVDVASIDPETHDLSVKNPNAPEEAPLRPPEEIIGDMLARDAETAQILEDIRGML